MYVYPEQSLKKKVDVGVEQPVGQRIKRSGSIGLEVERDKRGFMAGLKRIFGIESKETWVAHVDKEKLGRDVGGSVKSFLIEDYGRTYPLTTPVTQTFNSHADLDFYPPVRQSSAPDFQYIRSDVDAQGSASFDTDLQFEFDQARRACVTVTEDENDGLFDTLECKSAFPEFRLA